MQVTLTPVCAYAVAIANSSDLAFYGINNRVHSLIYWLSIFNCSIISYFIAVSLEKSPSLKAFLHQFMYALNHTALNHTALN